MNVLFHQIRDENFPSYGHRLDFMSDSLFHGLRSLLGEGCVDFPKMDHMYKENFDQVKTDKCKGFSLYNRLDDIFVDRFDVGGDAACGMFDLCVLSIHHSMNYRQGEVQERLNDFLEIQDRIGKICVIDGNDSKGITWGPKPNCPVYKREFPLANGCEPIAFSIPKENIVNDIPNKTRDFATIIPAMHGHEHLRTYVFDDETVYNKDYQDSYFGFTSTKGGFDCLRHYEIIANGCLPYFTDVEVLVHSYNTMFNWPCNSSMNAKRLDGVLPNWKQYAIGTCMEVLNTYGHTIDHTKFNKNKYEDLLVWLLDYARNNLTTEWMAKYLLGTMNVTV